MAVAAFLHAVAARRPLVLLLDDIHSANVSSLLLLEYVARDLGDAALLIAAAYRNTDVGAGGLADLSAHLARVSTAVPLRGLDTAAIRALVGSLAGRARPIIWSACCRPRPAATRSSSTRSFVCWWRSGATTRPSVAPARWPCPNGFAAPCAIA